MERYWKTKLTILVTPQRPHRKKGESEDKAETTADLKDAFKRTRIVAYKIKMKGYDTVCKGKG